jgi:hypothetical protein
VKALIYSLGSISIIIGAFNNFFFTRKLICIRHFTYLRQITNNASPTAITAMLEAAVKLQHS